MKRCLIHIGMHKTGSTTIQKNLKRIGTSGDWSYLTLERGKANMNENLHAMFATRPEKYHTFKKAGVGYESVALTGARLRGKFENRIRNAPGATIVISSEAVSQMDKDGVVRLGDFLRPLFDEIQVFGYVRAPAGFMASSFQERVKHGKGRFEFVDCYPKYRFRFKKFDNVFGRKNVRLVKFDPARFEGNCALREFCKQTGIALPEGAVVEKWNESLSREACGILLAYYKFGPGYGVGEHVIKENRALIQALLETGREKFEVARNLVEPVLEMNRRDVEWMERRLGETLREKARASILEVSCEEELLSISLPALKEFAERFSALSELRAPKLPRAAGDDIDPRVAACYLQSCRELVGRELRGAALRTSRRESITTSLWRRFRQGFHIHRD